MASVTMFAHVFSPDGVSSAQIMTELALDLQRSGHSVSVVATAPHYNVDAAAEGRQPLRRRWFGLLLESEIGGIRVYHTRHARKRGGLGPRVVGLLTLHVLGLAVMMTKLPRPDVVFVPSPLLSQGLVGWLVARLRGGRLIYNVQEMHPDLAIRMGKLRNPLAIRVLRWMERFIYDQAAAVTVIGPSMKRRIEAKAIPAEKVHVIPNFADLDDLAPLPKRNAFSEAHRLDDRFVVCYAGNMGFAQGLQHLIGAADLLRDQPDILIVFVGGGVVQAELEASVRARGLGNVRFITHQPYEMVPAIYASSDVNVVPMMGSIGGEAIPSKVFRIMACEKPILAMTELTSDLAEIVRSAGTGAVVSEVSAAALAKAIRDMHDAPEERERMGAAGRAYVAANASRASVSKRYAELVASLTSEPAR